ncbi:MAG: hypothetical protein ACYDGM_10800 [Vulcanimicrobiaceae bacterium]
MVQLLGSFIGARNQYTLIRLEFAMKHGGVPAPPSIARLAEPSERALHEDWPAIEEQLEAALAYAKRLERERGKKFVDDPATQWLLRSVREMDQVSRAIRWVLTVTQREDV